MIDLAKFQLDIGLSTTDRDGMLSFWQDDVGLTYDGPLSVGRGVQQHRHSFRGSIIKINHHRDGIGQDPPTGLSTLTIAQVGRSSPMETADPDGNRVRLVPPGTDGVTQLALEIAVRDIDAHRSFWADVVGLEAAPRSGPHAFRVGDSVLSLRSDPGAPADASRNGVGLRYLTLQVWDADAEFRRCVAAGAGVGHEPFTHGEVARYGFIRDPDGNWIELSQRGSLVGAVASIDTTGEG